MNVVNQLFGILLTCTFLFLFPFLFFACSGWRLKETPLSTEYIFRQWLKDKRVVYVLSECLHQASDVRFMLHTSERVQ